MYNATCYSIDTAGKVAGVCVVELDGANRIRRSNALWSPANGTDDYEPSFLRLAAATDMELRIVDGTRDFAGCLRRWPVPPKKDRCRRIVSFGS